MGVPPSTDPHRKSIELAHRHSPPDVVKVQPSVPTEHEGCVRDRRKCVNGQRLPAGPNRTTQGFGLVSAGAIIRTRSACTQQASADRVRALKLRGRHSMRSQGSLKTAAERAAA